MKDFIQLDVMQSLGQWCGTNQREGTVGKFLFLVFTWTSPSTLGSSQEVWVVCEGEDGKNCGLLRRLAGTHVRWRLFIQTQSYLT